MISRKQLFIGIDPGWKNLGVSLLRLADPEKFKFEILLSKTFNPSLDPLRFAHSLPIEIIKGLEEKFLPEFLLRNLTMERFVPYKGIQSAESENILILMGNIQMMFYLNNPVSEQPLPINLVRAIDWKIPTLQFLNKYFNFENDEAALNKKFSLKAAKSIVTNPELIKTDHEADSVCIAAFPYVEEFIQKQKSKGRADSSN